jgi:hypothetical protein
MFTETFIKTPAIRLSMCLILFAFLIPAESSASVISIETSVSAVSGDNGTMVRVDNLNKGDEPAFNLKVNVDINGTRISGRIKDKFAVKDKFSEEFQVAAKFQKPGRYPVIVTTEYTDANLYPFSAVSVSYVNHKESANALVVGTLHATKIAQSGEVSLTVKNLDAAKRKYSVRMVAARELSVVNPAIELALNPLSESTIKFEVRNLSALPDSSYPVFAVMTYEDEQYFYTAVNSGLITIGNTKPFGKLKMPLLAVFILLVSMIAVYYLRAAYRRSKRGR